MQSRTMSSFEIHNGVSGWVVLRRCSAGIACFHTMGARLNNLTPNNMVG